MADDKRGREKQADDEERRQRKRAVAEELERGDEPEPTVDQDVLADLEADVQAVEFPATGAEIVEVVGDQEVEAADGAYAVADLLPETDAETFESPAEVRVRVQRPTVAATMKRVVEASDALSNEEFGASQRDAYEKTLRALAAIDADDDDEGVRVVGDWIVEQMRTEERLPGSRQVRKRGAKYARANGYEVRNDDWLGA